MQFIGHRPFGQFDERFDAIWLTGAEGQGHDTRMGKSELRRCRRGGDCVSFTDFVKTIAPVKKRRIALAGHFAVVKKLAAGEESAVKNGRVRDGDSGAMQFVHERSQGRRMPHDGVGVRKHDPIEGDAVIAEPPDDGPVLGPDAHAVRFAFGLTACLPLEEGVVSRPGNRSEQRDPF